MHVRKAAAITFSLGITFLTDLLTILSRKFLKTFCFFASFCNCKTDNGKRSEVRQPFPEKSNKFN